MHISQANYYNEGDLILEKHTLLTAVETNNPALYAKAAVLLTGLNSPDGENFRLLTDWLKRPLSSTDPRKNRPTLFERLNMVGELLSARRLPLFLPSDQGDVTLLPANTDLTHEKLIPILGNLDRIASQGLLAIVLGVAARTIINPNKVLTPGGPQIVLDGRSVRAINHQIYGGWATVYTQQGEEPDIVLYPPESRIW